VSGRDFIDFVLLTPSVNVGRSTAVGAQSPFTETVLKLSFSGVRESHTSFFALDGADYTTSISGVQRVSPSQDWVQEFRVVDSPYTGDNGRNLGSVVREHPVSTRSNRCSACSLRISAPFSRLMITTRRSSKARMF